MERTEVAQVSISPLRLLILVGSLSALFAFALDMYLPALPALTDDYDASASLGQLTLTGALIGLALGQLIAGPLSDTYGRRTPLFCGIGIFVGASVACIFAPSIYWMIGLRTLQGAGAAAGVAIGRAIVRDLYDGDEAARLYSRLMLVIGVSPIVAPLVGSQLLRLTDWQGIFVALAMIGGSLLLVCARSLPETHLAKYRSRGGIRETVGSFSVLTRDRRFVSYMLVAGLGTGALFAHIAGSPFVVQDVYGGSPELFALLFGLNAIGLVTGSQVNARLVSTVGMTALLRRGCTAMAVAGVALLVVVCIPGLGVWSIVPPMVVMLTSFGFVGPNAVALGMARHPDMAGRASAMLGVFQFGVGAMLAPLVGIAGKDTAVPLGIVIATALVASLVQLLVLTRDDPPRSSGA